MSPNESAAKLFAVNWNNHMNHVRKAFDNLLTNSELTDVVLYAEGGKIAAHKVLLSACSTYFNELFKEFPQDRPIVVLKGVSYAVLNDILKFIYNGEVSVESSVFDVFLQTAEFLQISGLTDTSNNREEEIINIPSAPKTQNSQRVQKRKRSNKKGNRTVQKRVRDDEYKLVKEDLQEVAYVSEQQSFDEEINIKLEDEKYDTETSTNADDDPLKCPICFKVFSHPYSLHHHKPVHSGGTKCPICHVVLSRKYNLKMHMRSRHNIIDAR